MKIVHGDEVESGGGTSYRGGTSSHKILLEGEQGSIDNFSLVMPSSPGRFHPVTGIILSKFVFNLKERQIMGLPAS